MIILFTYIDYTAYAEGGKAREKEKEREREKKIK